VLLETLAEHQKRKSGQLTAPSVEIRESESLRERIESPFATPTVVVGLRILGFATESARPAARSSQIPWRKAQTTKRRELSLSAFRVNPWVAQFRYRKSSSPKKSAFITTLQSDREFIQRELRRYPTEHYIYGRRFGGYWRSAFRPVAVAFLPFSLGGSIKRQMPKFRYRTAGRGREIPAPVGIGDRRQNSLGHALMFHRKPCSVSLTG
jgi:hypothetical protein